MQLRKFFLTALALAALLACGRWVWHQVGIDRCLDHGGRWDAQRSVCEGAREGG